MKMLKKEARARGRISPAALIAVIILFGLALVTGWWYSGDRLPLTKPQPLPDKPKLLKQQPKKLIPGLEKSLILEDRISDVAELAMPVVVNVFTEKVIQMRGHSRMFDDPFFRFFFGPGFKSVPKERRERSLGSGVIVTEDGYILTANHVVEDADEIRVALSDKREFEAHIIGLDPQTDLAVLKIDADDLPVLAIGDSDRVRVGQVVLAIGNPFGLSGSVSMGIVSALGRTKVLDPRNVGYQDFIQTDAAINPGNSGGALINLSGELIGINTAIFSRSGGYQGIGFAIPSNLARNIMESLISSGSVKRGWLGVAIQDLTPDLAQEFGLSEPSGALVSEVYNDTPADKAGIKPGDVIVAIEGEEVSDMTDLRNTIAEHSPGSEVEVEVVRDGKRKDIDVTLGERPTREELAGISRGAPRTSVKQAEAAGMTVTDLTPELADQLGIESGRSGVVVIDVEPGSRAGRAEVLVGDIIFRMNRRSIVNVSDFDEVAKRVAGRALLLHVRRRGSSIFIVVPK